MRARKTGVKLPYVKLNAVLYAENILGIEDLAYYAVENHVNEMQYERMEPQTDLRPPSELKDADPDHAAEALRQIKSAKAILEANNITASFHGDLISTLEACARA